MRYTPRQRGHFISHMVQIIHLCRIIFHYVKFEFYIPHGSDNTIFLKHASFLQKHFISHMVQIIQGCPLFVNLVNSLFISHMVQIIPSVLSIPYPPCLNFISHMVQIILGAYVPWGYLDSHFYIPHGSDNTDFTSNSSKSVNNFISHMVQIIPFSILASPFNTKQAFISHMVQIILFFYKHL